MFVISFLLCSINVSAYDFKIDGIYYNIVSVTDLTVEVTNGDTQYSGSVVIPETVTYKTRTLTVAGIGNDAFRKSGGLKEITIPGSVSYIGDHAFNGCTSLKNVCIEDADETLELGCNDLMRGRCLFHDCPLETLYLGRNLKYDISSFYAEDSAYSPFYKIPTLTTVIIGNKVTSIDERAFAGCSALSNVTIGSGVTSIGVLAFNGCCNLTSISIGSGIKSIGKWAFDECDKLESIYLMSGKPATISSDNFTNKQYIDVVLYVPSGTLATFQTADNWKNFWDIREFDPAGTKNNEAK